MGSCFCHHFSNFGRPPVPDDLGKDSATRHSRFWRRRFLKVFTIYGHGSHLGKWTATILAPRRIIMYKPTCFFCAKHHHNPPKACITQFLNLQPVIWKHSFFFQQMLKIHSPMKRNHSLLEYTRDNDTQVSELGPSEPSCLAHLRYAEDELLWSLFIRSSVRPCVR